MAKKEKTKTCIVTRQTKRSSDLIRFVIDPQDNVVPDIKEKLPGRGVWITNRRSIVQKACKRNFFSAGFKQQAKPCGKIIQNIETLLLKDLQQSLSIAKKSGFVVSGFSKVEALVRNGDAEILLHACDGREDGLKKMRAAIVAAHAKDRYEEGQLTLFNKLSSAQLDAAIGTDNIVHIALVKGGATDNLKEKIRRLDSYCGETSK